MRRGTEISLNIQETLRARIGLLRLLRWVERRRRYLLITFNCLSEAVPAGIALGAGWLITTTESVLADSGEPNQLAPPLVALVAMFVLAELSDSARSILGLAAADDVERHVRQRIRQVSALSGAIDHLEDEHFQDDLFSASSDQGERRKSAGTAAVGQLLLTFRFLGAVLACVVVALYSPVLALVLLTASLLSRATVRRQWIGLADIFLAHVPTLRRSEYLSELVVGGQAARDVRTYGLGKWLTERRQNVARSSLIPLWQKRKAVLRNQGLVIFLTLGSSFAALLVPRLLASRGALAVGELVTCLMAGFAALAIGSMGHEAFDIENGIVAAESYERIEERRWDVSERLIPASPLRVPRIVFRDVTFSYRDREPVLSSLDLEIHPGEVLAIVGANGAGKTTLTKLLAGLHQPTSGAIEIDGQDLRSVSLSHWRTRLYVLFQDFVHYPGSLRDNVSYAVPESQDDVAGVSRALGAAGADSLLDSLPNGIDTLLWRGGEGGVDLSGGEWQKVGLARTVFSAQHGRHVLILDEPTAHLDVDAEIEFFDRVTRAARGATVVLISHRLSTIRRADRIVLLSGGRVAESGSHAALLKADGEYARMFALQASRFEGASLPQ